MDEGTAGTEEALRRRVLTWLEDDPDRACREELHSLVTGLPKTATELVNRFSGPLRFGTAGLRGPLRAGPNGMNRAVVRATTAGLASWLARRSGDGPVVIGFDARHGSAEFAQEAARVLTGAGRPALILPRPLPTPVLAFAVRHLSAVAGVMVTASHNPASDNGYKVYLGEGPADPTGEGAQLAPPADAEIEAEIRAVGPLSAVPLGAPGRSLDDDVVEAYLREAATVVAAPGKPALRVAYTPLHGVGAATFTAAMVRAGFPRPIVVPDQVEPDPGFPTVAFPNPEEPGALDRLLALASARHCDLAIAHDPDADRCALAVPDPESADGPWRILSGDELGVLLADHLMRQGKTGRYATSVVSSSQLGRICAARGLPYSQGLTGFKWLVRTGGDLAYAYEEALGYCVAPGHVRDKDGITAALLACELVAESLAGGQTLPARLDLLAWEAGVHATGQVPIRFQHHGEAVAAVERFRHQPPSSLGGAPVTAVEDLLPKANVIVVRAPGARVIVRPSGTEPKLKAYLEVVEPVAGPRTPAPTARRGLRADERRALEMARRCAAERLGRVRAEVGAALAG